MLRQRQSLDGQWQFVLDPESQFSLTDIDQIEHWHTIEVPMPWQAQFDDLRLSTGTGWYRKTFHIPNDWKDQSIILYFSAVFYHAQVWLNGHYLGEDENGYLPFEFLVQSYLHFGVDNELTVRVTTPNDDREKYPDYPFSEILHGKQSWYGHWGGIWQSVWVEARSATHIKQVQLFPDSLEQTITCVMQFRYQTEQMLEATVVAPDGKQVAQTTHKVMSEHAKLLLKLDSPPLQWSPNTPHLYHIQFTIDNGDCVEKSCGFRTIETREGQVLLNGEPFHMRGALDQDYYPDTLSTPSSVEFLEDQFQKAKAMGLNTLRYHIKIADPRYYDMADQLGILLWVDLPNWQSFTDPVKQRVRQTFERMLQRDGHHPSIAIWTIVNEDWGTDLVNEQDHRDWLREAFDWLKEQDPTRLVVDNSACEPNFHLKSDLDDYHFYRAYPEHAADWDQVIDDFANRADFSFSPYGDHDRTYKEPLIVSEFGNWGLPHPSDLHDNTGQEPWWFETGHDWAEGIVYPHGIEQRFQQWHLERTFGDFNHLIEATQWQQYAALKYEIECIRLRPAIQGYIITELTDLHWECNGLLDMRRNPRVFYQKMADLNSDVMVIARCENTAYFSGSPIQIQLNLSLLQRTYIKAIRWTLQNEDENHYIHLEAEYSASVHATDDILFEAPYVTQPTTLVLNLEILEDENTVLHRNHLEIVVLPQMQQYPEVFTSDDALTDKLRTVGYSISANSNLLVTNRVDTNLLDHLRAGGKALCLVNGQSGLPVYQSGTVIQQTFPYLSISPRENTIWQGDWVSSFAWIHPKLISLDLPYAPLMGIHYKHILPDHVLLGGTRDDFHQDVLSGLFVGWIQRPVATTIVQHFREGQVVFTTLKLLEPALANNPMARHILFELIRGLK